MESISDGVFTVDLSWRITYFNHAAEQITGVKREEALGKNCADVFRSSKCIDKCPLRQTLSGSQPRVSEICYIITANGEQIPISISTAVIRDEQGGVIGGAETFRDLSEIQALRAKLEEGHQLGNINSRSPLLHKIFASLPAIANSSSTVLLLGETGTGKELLARTIHSLSPRAKKPFLAVNCAAIPDTLLESELFGYKAGAFTGAKKDKKGRFTLANGGTLFLDEIGDISSALQVRLLRILQEKEFEPLGATKTEKVDIRIITATNKDLDKEVNEGRFREDLFYRINVVRIELPPLRKRKEDIPLLTAHFISHFNALQGKKIEGVTNDVLGLLMAYDWRGNIRELENIIERAFLLCEGGYIGPEHIPREIYGDKMEGTINVPHLIGSGAVRSLRERTEATFITEALKRNAGNCTATARELGVHKTTLFRKIKRLGIKRK